MLLYAKSWRGAGAGIAPVTYRFDAPFTILGGFDEAAVSEGGTVLSLPGAGFHDGLLFFGGPLTALGVEANATAVESHAMTLAVVPEPAAVAASLASLATLIALRRL